jgi:hypothetical protein
MCVRVTPHTRIRKIMRSNLGNRDNDVLTEVVMVYVISFRQIPTLHFG